MLGPLELTTEDGTPVPLGGARLRALLIALATEPGRVVGLGALTGAVWGDDLPADPANALQALVSRLRRAVPGLEIRAEPTGYRLAITHAATDIGQFDRLLAAGRAELAADPAAAARTLREALALWRGPALAGLPGADSGHGFGAGLAARLRERRLTALHLRIDADLALGRAGDLVPELEGLAAEHPLHEPLACQLIRALYQCGRSSEALAAYEQVRSALAGTLGADPSPELSALYLEILRAEPKVSRTNLRAGLTSFVGRADELARVGGLLASTRLVTLTGPGGAGKTRLATEAARRALPALPDGVWVAEFAPVTDPAELPSTVLSTLGVREHSLFSRWGQEHADAASRLESSIADRELLLVLDNCEHLIDGAAKLADRLLGACPKLRILTTSREPLGILGESLWPVGPLGLPSSEVDVSEALGYSAVRLLAERAAAVQPGFTLDASNVSAVVEICRALDGQPLAIELAAARFRALSPEQVAERLGDRFRLLTGGSRVALPRHQTLRAVVDWSWELLDEPERDLWRQFAVFAGGADLAAVEAVCGAGPDLLAALVDKSLIVMAGGRYRMLETIRAYGIERLAEAGQAETARARHAAYFLDLALEADSHMRSAEQVSWLSVMDDDHDNLHRALRQAIAAGDRVTAVRLAAALGSYWWLRSHRAEGAELAREALAMPGEQADRESEALALGMAALNLAEGHEDIATAYQLLRTAAAAVPEHPGHRQLKLIRPIFELFETAASGPSVAGVLALQEDPDPWVRASGHVIYSCAALNLGLRTVDVIGHCEAALAGFRSVGDRWGMSLTLSSLADLTTRAGDFAAAAGYYADALVLIRELGHTEDVPQLLARIGHLHWLLGEPGVAEQRFAEAAEATRHRVTGEVPGIVEYLRAEVARQAGDPQRALVLLDRARACLQGIGSSQVHALMLNARALLALAAGDVNLAGELAGEAYDKALGSMDAPVVAHTLVTRAALCLKAGQPAEAAYLLGSAIGVPGTRDHSLVDAPPLEAAALDALGECEYRQAFERGLATTLDDLTQGTDGRKPKTR